MAEITELKEVTETKYVTVGYKCDSCGKVHTSKDLPNDWHEFNGHHNSWGCDSVDSYQYYVTCGLQCYGKLLREAIESFKDYDDSEIDGFSLGFARKMSEFFNNI